MAFEKALLGVEDILRDFEGVSRTSNVRTSTGGARNITGINASHIPVTTTVRNALYADGTSAAAAGDIDVDAILHQILNDLDDLGQPDGTTLENSSGTLQIKDLGVSTAKIADDAVTGPKIPDDTIDSPHYIDGSIDSEHLNSTNGSEAVTQGVIRAGAVGTTELADNAANIDKMDMDGSGTAPAAFIVSAVRASLGGGASSETVGGFTGLTAGMMFLATWNINNATVKDIRSVEYNSPTQVTLTTSANIVASDVVTIIALKVTST